MKGKSTLTNADPRLKAEVYQVARRLRSIELMKRATRRWLAASAVGIAFIATSLFVPLAGSFLVFAMLSLIAIVLFLNRRDAAATPLDHLSAALRIERTHPSLEQALSTALEQEPDGKRLNFLQRKLVDDALDHETRSEWRSVGVLDRKDRWKRHLAACAPIWLLLLLSFFLEKPIADLTPDDGKGFAAASIEIHPGNTEAERGSTVVVTARFEGEALPQEVALVAVYPDGTETRSAMGQSLSDPVFAHSIQRIDSKINYFVEYDSEASEVFEIEIFELPALIQADATLDYPEYTKWPDRFVEDTLRVSAVEGTELTYSFATNKPLENAILKDRDGQILELQAANPERTRFEARMDVDRTQRYTLHLSDDRGRQNPFPPDVRIDALKNKRPDLEIAFPKGDQRVSPIEEVALEAQASDDFGLLDYGVAYSIGAESPVYLSKRIDDAESLESVFAEMLALEETEVEADDLLSWFAWADDYGPDGSARRSTSDLYFAEVRSLDEIFRENEGGGQQQGQQQGQGNQNEELIEMQRQVAIALWKLKQRGDNDPNFIADSEVIHESQQEIRGRLEELKPRLEEEKAQKTADLAGNLMDSVIKNLDTALSDESEDPIDPAWSSAQGATQALLRMQPKEFNVSRSRQGGGGGGGQSRNQRQLDQLEFRNEENRYETASQAQGMASPEQKGQLQVLSKLSELARRQQDLNERLQELQTAIAAAEDEEEKERIRRELRRLEEEQRQMLADVDEARQRMDRLQSNESNRESRQRLDQAREEMQQLGEELGRGEVSQALATGTRAQENLEELKDDFRNETSSQFAEQLRDARKAARDLAEQQRAISEELEALDQGAGRRLDNSEEREGIAESLREQQAELEGLMNQLREVTEASEFSEQRLHRELYEVLRESSQSDVDQRLQTSADMLSQGFIEQTQDMQPELQRSFDELQRQVEQAANSVLGDEANTLRFAEDELDSLSKDLQANAPGRGEQEGQSEANGRSGGRSEPREGESERAQGGLANADSQEPGQSSPNSQDGQAPQSQANAGQPGQQPGSQPGQQPGQGAESPSGQPGQSGEGGQGQSSQPSLAQSEGSQSGGGQGSSGGSPSSQEQAGQRPGQPFSNQGPGGMGGGGGGGGANDLATSLDRLLDNFGGGIPNGPDRSPITGRGFNEWNERLRTVEELVDQPDIRQRLSQAREQVKRMRSDFKRHGSPPQWGVVEEGIVAPLNDARSWVRQELTRHENPNAIQPIDRDPVPRAYQESVRKYYESLGQ